LLSEATLSSIPKKFDTPSLIMVSCLPNRAPGGLAGIRDDASRSWCLSALVP
jgi:hypothetical protein